MAIDHPLTTLSEIILQPRWPALSPLGRAVAWGAIPWFAIVLASGFVGVQLAFSGDASRAPIPLRILVLLLGLAPAGLWIAARRATPGKSALLLPEGEQPKVRFNHQGLEMYVSNVRTSLSWEAIGSLDASPRWFGSRMLRSPDGAPLAVLPERLAHGRVGSGTATAAECAVAARPDLFRLEHNSATGRPLGFSRHGTASS
jgi:hypothetical protein